MDYKKVATGIRKSILKMHAKANASHIGSSLSCVDILVVLYFNILKIDPCNPNSTCRDRLIFSKGHASSALYATLASRGFFPKNILDEYCQNGGRLSGHTTRKCVPGVEVSAGSLGHGLAMAIGMAIAAKYEGQKHRVFMLLSDGECDEGSVWEGAMFASHHKLDNLVVVVDYNKFQALGKTNEVLNLEPLGDKWTSFGWSVKEIGGHNFEEIAETLSTVPFEKGKPSVVIAHTIKGKGVSFMEDKLVWHYKSPNEEELESAFEELDAL